jgi:hypothetical protein
MSWTETLFLKKIIDGKKGLVASENFYAEIPVHFKVDSEDVTTGSKENIFKVKWSGSFKLVCKGGRANQSNYANATLLKNGEDVSTVSLPFGTGETNFGTITFKKGDVFGIALKGEKDYTRPYVNSFLLYADVTDLSAFEIIEEEVV